MLGQPSVHSRLRGRAAPGADRADPARRRPAQLRHPQRHAGRRDRPGPAAVDRRAADLARRPRHRRVGHAQGPGLPHRPVPPRPPQGSAHMLNLAEYRTQDHRPVDYLPWACLVGPGIVLNKDGSFQRTLRYRGPDLDSATEAELVSVSARLNNVLKRFGAGWALFFEAERVPANQYPGARFADPASWLVDQERYAAFSADGAHHESRYFLTFLYLPPPEHEARAERFLYERTRRDGRRGRAARPARLVRHRDRPRPADARRPSCPRRRRSATPRRSPTCTAPSPTSATRSPCRPSRPISMPSCATRRSSAASSRSSATSTCAR